MFTKRCAIAAAAKLSVNGTSTSGPKWYGHTGNGLAPVWWTPYH